MGRTHRLPRFPGRPVFCDNSAVATLLRRARPAVFILTEGNNDPVWRLATPGPLPMRCWDGDYVVYNPLSGNTHVLDVVTGEVLARVMSARVPDSELCQHIAEFLDVPNDSRLVELVRNILTVLDGLGLIEPAGGC